MKTHRRDTSIVPSRPALLAALLLALPLAAMGQGAPHSSSSTAPMAIDHAGMPDMTMPTTADGAAEPAKKAHAGKAVNAHLSASPAPSPDDMHDMSRMDHGSMPGMVHGPMPAPPAVSGRDAPVVDHQAMPGMSHAAAHAANPAPDDRAPAAARSGDYSDGIPASSAHGLHMHGSTLAGMLLIDQLEAFHGRDGNGQSWEAEGWYGNDADKLWLRSEGERSGGKLEDGELEVLWNHAATAFWSTQLGVRHDAGIGSPRDWATLGVQGLAPYWFEIEATAYAGPSGRTAVRLRAEYELLFTQRLILQPDVEVNLYGRPDRERRIGSGLADAQLGLRLRYEIRREVAPYVGVVWTQRFGGTAAFAREDREAVFDRQWVAGIRIWF